MKTMVQVPRADKELDLLLEIEGWRKDPCNRCQHCDTPLQLTVVFCFERLTMQDYAHSSGYCSKCDRQTDRYRDDETGERRLP